MPSMIALLGCLAALLAGSPAAAQLIDFDALAPGTIVTTIAPATFSHSDQGIDLVVASGLPSTSAPNALGAAYLYGPTNDPQSLFLPGEVLALALAAPATQISLAVISTPGTPAGAFELSTPSGSTTSGAVPDAYVGDDEVFLLSFSSGVAFTSAELRSSYADGLFAFHVDDVFVPEPSLGWLLAAGLPALATIGRRRR